MAKNRRPYIVGVKKIAREARDTFNSYVPDPESMYEDIDGGGDEEREIGEPARYRVDLTDEGYEAFRAASNLRYIEPDENATDRISRKGAKAQRTGRSLRLCESSCSQPYG